MTSHPWQDDIETRAPNGPWGNETSKGKYLYDNGLCGLKDLSYSQCPAVLLYGYSRFGTQDPIKLLEENVRHKAGDKAWKKGDSTDDAQWIWPFGDGFLRDRADNTKPMKKTITLGEGMLIDHFVGSDDSNYFAPFGTPFSMRALPPSSLNDDYRVYRVLKPFEVMVGPIAPGFQQTGLGTQYVCEEEKQQGKTVAVKSQELIADGKISKPLTTNEVKTLYGKPVS